MLNNNRLASICGLFVAIATLLAAPTPVFAEEEAVMEEVVVTGSRIRRSDISSSAPITVISGQTLLDSGATDLGEALRQQPSAGTAGFNQTSTLSGGGATSIDLRNLGPDRVLILINGRRVASFADSLANQAADLTFIPTAMVDRVEILRDGASAVYGSDAITGVVNVILKKDFEGAEFTANTGVSSEGDGEQYGAALTLGTVSDRGNIVVGVEYREQENIPQVDRDWAFPAISSLSETGFNNGSFFSPGGVFFADDGQIFCTRAKALGGDEVTNVAPDCESFRAQSSRDELARYDYALRQDILVGSKVVSTSGYGNYNLTDDVNVYAEMQFSKRRTDSHLDGNPGSFGTPTFPAGSVVPATNPNNPTGSDGIFFFRPTSTIGPRTSNHESNTFRLVTGLEGSIPGEMWFSDEWAWDLSYLYTRVDADLTTNATWNLARFIRISDPALCAVDTQCAQVVNPSGALDTLRPGNWTEDEIEYMRQISSARSEFQTQGFQGLITGPVANLPAGSVEVALGFETRKEKGFNKPDSVTEAGESVANQTFTTSGGYDVDEFFAEVDVPLLAGVPFAERLTLNLQARTSDYSNFGSEDVYRVGIDWQVTPDIRFRANSSTAYRAPTVTDLFGGGTVSFDFVDDPCQGATPGSNTAQNCLLDGVDPATFLQPTGQYPVLAGSNPDLQPETADTYTVGFVFTPRFLEGFSVIFDVWDIEVEDLVSRNTSTSVLEDCYGGAVGLTDPACNNFDGRTAQGIPVNFINRLSNLTEVETDGFDLTVAYEFDGFSGTYWNLELRGTYVDENSFSPGAGGADDRGSIPRVVANFRADVAWQDWNFSWLTRYISDMNDPRFDGNNPFGYSGPDDYDKHDIRASYRWDRYRFMVGVNNVFDEDPPYVFSTGNNTDTFLYDVIGRYMFARVTVEMF